MAWSIINIIKQIIVTSLFSDLEKNIHLNKEDKRASMKKPELPPIESTDNAVDAMLNDMMNEDQLGLTLQSKEILNTLIS